MSSSGVRPLLFLGASTAFLEIQEIIHDINRVEPRHRIIGLLDDAPALHGTSVDGVPVLGPLELARDYPDADLVFGIGSHLTRLVRHKIIERLGIPDERFVNLVHPAAKVYPSVRMGPGCIVHSGVVLANDVVLDGFNVVTFSAAVGPWGHLRRYSMVTTMAVLLSRVDLGQAAFIGAGACVQDGVRIGAGALVGMAAAVYRDVPRGAVVLGNPARIAYRVRVPADLPESELPVPRPPTATTMEEPGDNS
jgi:sugar O-acyltransferase (sialic acid O-acetyltransferase NeuD family)